MQTRHLAILGVAAIVCLSFIPQIGTSHVATDTEIGTHPQGKGLSVVDEAKARVKAEIMSEAFFFGRTKTYLAAWVGRERMLVEKQRKIRKACELLGGKTGAPNDAVRRATSYLVRTYGMTAGIPDSVIKQHLEMETARSQAIKDVDHL